MTKDGLPIDGSCEASGEVALPERRRSLLSALLCGSMLVKGVMGLAGCATTVDGRVEEIVTAELPRIIGPAATYEVVVEGASVTGNYVHLRRVRVMGERVARPKSPILDRVDVSMSDVVIDRVESRVVKLSAAEGKVRILAQDIAIFLDARPGLDNVVVTFHPPYEMTVESQFSAAGYALPAIARGKLRGRLVASKGGLMMEIMDLRLAGFPIGTIPAFVLERLMNPLVDLSALPVPSQVRSVEATQFSLLLTTSGNQNVTVTPAGDAERTSASAQAGAGQVRDAIP